jgi:hypothetical protein
MRVRIGVATTSTDHQLTVNASAFDGIQLQSGGSDCGYLGVNTDTVYVGAGSNLIFHTGNAGLTNGSERMRIDSSGKAGIGTSSPTGSIHVTTKDSNGSDVYYVAQNTTSNRLAGYKIFDESGNVGGVFQYDNGSNALNIGTAINTHFSFNTNNTERMRIESDGDLKISGTIGGNSTTAFASMAGRLTFDTDYSDTQRGPNKVVLQEDGAWIAGLGISNDSTDFYSGGHMTFRTGTSLGTERMRILSGGDVCIGKTTNDINTQGFHFIGAGTYSGSVYSGITSAVSSSTYHLRDTTNNTWEFYVTNAGLVYATHTSIQSLSDERLKENIVDLETGLDEIMALKPRRFDWKDRKEKQIAGFVAQEVEPVLPDLVGDFMHDDLDDAKSVRMGDMIPTLVKAIQELKAEIEELKK